MLWYKPTGPEQPAKNNVRIPDAAPRRRPAITFYPVIKNARRAARGGNPSGACLPENRRHGKDRPMPETKEPEQTDIKLPDPEFMGRSMADIAARSQRL